MTNEELIALNDGFNDDAVFSRECLKINDKLGRKIRLDYGPAQVKLAALIAKLRAQRSSSVTQKRRTPKRPNPHKHGRRRGARAPERRFCDSATPPGVSARRTSS